MSNDDTDRRNKRAWFMLSCIGVSVVAGIGSAVVKERWGEGLASQSIFYLSIVFMVSVLTRLFGFHPSQHRKRNSGEHPDG